MTVLTAILAIVGVAAVGTVVTDLLTDVPRVAQGVARVAVRILRPSDRPFFGWAAEIDHAARDSFEGRRSRLSVLLLAVGMLTSAARHRIRRQRVAHAFNWSPESVDTVKILVPTYMEDGFQSEGVWADPVSEDLYRIDNHLLFTEVACAGDVVRVRPRTDEGFTWLEFVEVVHEAERREVHLWSSWRIFARSRLRRLHRRLRRLGMSSEWIAPQYGRGSLPGDPELGKVLRLLRRSRVHWEVVERRSPRAPETEVA